MISSKNEPFNATRKKNKKGIQLLTAKLYDNMIYASYTLDNGDLNKEKILNQSYSFTKQTSNSKMST